MGCPLGCPREAPVLVWCLFPLAFYNIAQADCFFKRQTYTRRGADIIRLLNRLLRFRIHVVECVIYNGGQSIGAVVFHLSIYVHCNFAVFMTGQVLNSFGIYPSIYQVRDICMPQLVWCHLKIQAVVSSFQTA